MFNSFFLRRCRVSNTLRLVCFLSLAVLAQIWPGLSWADNCPDAGDYRRIQTADYAAARAACYHCWKDHKWYVGYGNTANCGFSVNKGQYWNCPANLNDLNAPTGGTFEVFDNWGYGSGPRIYFYYCTYGNPCPAGTRYDAVTNSCVSDVNKGAGPPSGGDCVGNPCNAANGNKYQLETDFSGSEGLPDVVRSYNSALVNSQGAGFGTGWTGSHRQRLDIDGTDIYIRQNSGRSEWFNCSVSPCVGDADTQLTLIKDVLSYVLTYADGTIERFSTTGQLTQRTTGDGKTSSYNYNAASGQLSNVIGPFGHGYVFTWDAGGLITSIKVPGGDVINYGYTVVGNTHNLVRVTYPDTTAKLYHYENATYKNHLTGISFVEANGTTTRYATYTYDASGKAISTEHAGGSERFTLQYDSPTQTTVTDAAGTSEVLTFTTNLGVKNVAAKKNLTDNKALTQTFDANNNLTCKQNEEGQVVTYSYNATNQKIGKTVGQGGTCAAPAPTPATRTTSYQYISPELDLPTVTESPSVYAGAVKLKTIAYNSARNPIAISDSGFAPSGAAVSRTVGLSYNAYGQVISIDGPRTDVADVTSLTYYECNTGYGCGQLKSITNAKGHTTTYDSYDANGHVLQTTDPNGLITSYTYDLRGRVASLVQKAPSGGNARMNAYSYTSFGAIATASQPGGLVLTYTYDAAQKLRAITDNLGNKVDYTYDLKGNRETETVTDASGSLVRAITIGYDIRNHIASINNAGSITQQFHNALGTLLSETDPNQNPATVHSPDTLGRVLQTIDRLSGATVYAYDNQDRLTQARAPNNATTQYSHDDLGNLLTEISPDRGTTQFTYDAAGNRKTQIDARGVSVSFTYDALNRLVFTDYPGADDDVIYTYDTHNSTVAEPCTHGLGRLCQTNDPSGITTYAYDAHGNLSAQDHRELGVSYITRYTYDAANRVSTVTYPNRRRVAYTRDPLGRVTHIQTTVGTTTTTVASNIQYRADGLPTLISYNNGVTETRQYNARAQLLNQLIGPESRNYNYDANGNLISLQNTVETHVYTPDPLDRLQRDQSAVPLSWTYDPSGNRLSQTASTTTRYQYALNSNRIIQVANTAYRYDAAGNLTQSGTRSYTYTEAGRLSRIQDGSTLRGTYTYNARNQRTRKVAGSTTTVYHYDIDGHLISETSNTGALKVVYIYLPLIDNQAIPIAHIQSNTITYLHTDALGTPRLGTAATTPKIVWRLDGD